MDEGERCRLEAAYRELGADLWRSIFAFAGGSRDVADEAVAEAFAQAGRRLGSIRDIRPWLYTAAFRLARGELRRRSRVAHLEEVPDTGDRTSESDGSESLDDLVRELSPNQRAVLVLRLVFGYPSSEAARLLGISEVAVRVHLHAARRRLRDRLREEVE